jgi:hypothetical protein
MPKATGTVPGAEGQGWLLSEGEGIAEECSPDVVELLEAEGVGNGVDMGQRAANAGLDFGVLGIEVRSQPLNKGLR